MLCCNIMNQLLNQYSLSYTSTAKQTDFTTLLIRAEKVYDFNTSFQNFRIVYISGGKSYEQDYWY